MIGDEGDQRVGIGGDDKFGQSFMSAEDLVELRELPDITVHHTIGEKSYMPSDEKSEDEGIKAFTEERKALLKIQKTSTIGSLSVAEWDADSQEVVAKKLEGKFTQHVGKSSQGKIILSPEETLFLLENESLELHCYNRPISVEEAYNLMMNSNHANLRYLVYIHLSLLGYTVVLHQGKIDTVTPYKKELNLAKQKMVESKKRKRKSSSIPRKKVTFDNKQSSIKESNTCNAEGANSVETRCEKPCVDSTSSSEQNSCILKANDKMLVTQVNVMADSPLEETNDSVSLGTAKEILSEVLISDTEKTAEVSEVSETQNVESSVCTVNDGPRPENTEKLDILLNEQETKKVIFSTEGKNEKHEITADETKESESVEPFDSEIVTGEECHVVVEAAEKCEMMKIDISNEQCVTLETSVAKTSENHDNEKEIEKVLDHSVEPFDSEIVTSDECHVVVDVAEKCEMMEIDISNEQCVALEMNVTKASENSSSDDEIENVLDQPDEEYENESMTSETSSNDSIVRIDTENDSLDFIDADVEIVTVTKKEKKPLAVINLFSDDEKEENPKSNANVKQNNSSDDDDDIQILEECSSTVKVPKKLAQASQEKKPKYFPPKIDVDFNNAVTWPFPNLLKKTVACLPRPPPHLMPNNVCLKKEAYTLDIRKLSGMANSQPPTRLWNSYKDLQSRKRGVATENTGFRGSPWNALSEQRPFSSQQSNNRGIHNDWNSRVGSPQSHSPAFMRGNEMNPNSSLTSQSAPMFVKSENSSVPSLFGNRQASSPVFHGIPQDNFSQFVSMAATQAAAQAARNVIMSMTGNMNVAFDCQTNSPMSAHNGDNVPFHGTLGRAPFLGSSMVSNVAVGRNLMEVMSDGNRITGDHRDVSQFPDRIQTSHLRTRDSPHDFHQHPHYTAPDSLPYHAHRDDFNRPVESGNNIRSFQMRSFTNGCNPFPSSIPKGPKEVASWHEYKSAISNSDITNDADDIVEVPINLTEMLWSKHLSPLTRSEIMQSSCDILKCSQITLPAKLIKRNAVNERFMPISCSLKMSFDVYLPNVIYKKTCPDIPNLRIVVVDAQDPFPKLGDIVFLARKFQDSASLVFAVVDDKDISYFSFVFMDLPELLP